MASVVGGAVIFNIEIKQPFALRLAEKVLEHPAALRVDATRLDSFFNDVVTVRIMYWIEGYQQEFVQLINLAPEIYDMAGGEYSDMAADSFAGLANRGADMAIAYGPNVGIWRV